VKIINKKSLISLLLLMTFMFLGSVGFVFAVDVDVPDTDLPTTGPAEILKNLLNWIATIVAVVSALVIVIAGIMWATAGGDEDRQGKARKMLISGVVGLIIALAAWGLVNVVLSLFGI